MFRPAQLPSRVETPATRPAGETAPPDRLPPDQAFRSYEVAAGVNLAGLQPAARAMLAGLVDYAQQQGIRVTVTSGYRDPGYQAALRARWDMGDRTGLVARPALRSAHSEGLAIDLTAEMVRRLPGQPDALAKLGAWAQLHGYQWGGTYRRPDPVHFAVRSAVPARGES